MKCGADQRHHPARQPPTPHRSSPAPVPPENYVQVGFVALRMPRLRRNNLHIEIVGVDAGADLPRPAVAILNLLSGRRREKPPSQAADTRSEEAERGCESSRDWKPISLGTLVP